MRNSRSSWNYRLSDAYHGNRKYWVRQDNVGLGEADFAGIAWQSDAFYIQAEPR